MNEKAEQTIITNISKAYNGYPYKALHGNLLQIIREDLPTKHKICHLQLFEGFLQLTNRSVDIESLTHPCFKKICFEYLGAIYSESFISLTKSNRYIYARSFCRLINQLKQKFSGMEFICPKLSTLGVTSDIQQCIKLYNGADLDQSIAWLWHGWPSSNRNNQKTFFPLYPVYERLGRDFTQSLYEVCDDYFSSRKGVSIPCLKPLTEFIGQYPKAIDTKNLQDPQFITQFWRDFFCYFIQTGYADGENSSIQGLILKWRNYFMAFVESYLVPSGLFTEPWGAMPSPEPKCIQGSKTNIKKTKAGIEVKTKLLTPIPLYLTDGEAIELLFSNIQKDLNIIVSWAKWSAKDIWKRYIKRKDLAPLGQIRFLQKSRHIKRLNSKKEGLKWICNRSNPDWLKNASSTFEHYGFVTCNDQPIQLLLPQPIIETAKALALPITSALLPHCVLLVANHPSITPSFLEKLRLYDKNGKLVGFSQTDNCHHLIGYKNRAGSERAQQIIHLTAETAVVVRQIIALTQPLRDYLKSKNDDTWRYLLLTCGQGFSYPKKVKLAELTSNPGLLDKLASLLEGFHNGKLEERRKFVQYFSLPAIRASAGTLIYLKTQSVEKMSIALGHSKYSTKLLAHYLPEPLFSFFQERWIRIFQNGIIVEALKDSEYLFHATDFDNIDELDEFVKKHALLDIPEHIAFPTKLEQNNQTESFSDEVVFGVNKTILAVLISLSQAVDMATDPINSTAMYWRDITEHLINHIEHKLDNRIDLQAYLNEARAMANPSSMKNIIHV